MMDCAAAVLDCTHVSLSNIITSICGKAIDEYRTSFEFLNSIFICYLIARTKCAIYWFDWYDGYVRDAFTRWCSCHYHILLCVCARSKLLVVSSSTGKYAVCIYWCVKLRAFIYLFKFNLGHIQLLQFFGWIFANI